MNLKSMVILAFIAYLFLFEVALSLKLFGWREEKLKGIFKLQHGAWMKFSHALGIVMSKIILTVLWIVGFGSYAIAWKIAHVFKRKKKDTYWKAISNEKNDMKYPF